MRRLIFSLSLILASAGMTGAARSADLGGDCCADLEDRIAELEATTARKGNRKVSLTIAGLINETIMAWDDGFENNVYIVTNEAKRTRVSVTGSAKVTADVMAGYNLELGPRGSRQDRNNQDNDDVAGGDVDVRYSYWFLKSKRFGQVAVGLQPQAYDTITEASLANTGHFARPAPTQQIGDSGRGFLLRLKDGTLTTLAYGNIVTQGVNGTPGEGHRVKTVRYDAPEIAGFVVSASWGEDDVWDAALRYKGEALGFKLAAGVGYGQWTDGSGADPRGCARAPIAPDIDCEELGMSASVMHVATGLFVTGGYGRRWDNNVRELYAGAAGVDETQDFYFAQAGIEQKWFSIGKTTLFGEFWEENAGPGLTTNGAQLVATPLGAARISGAEITMWGAGVNQTVADGVDLYLSYRHIEADVFTSANGGKPGSTKVEIERFQYVTAGAAIKF